MLNPLINFQLPLYPNEDPAYMAKDPVCSESSDIFGLGRTAYKVLTGSPIPDAKKIEALITDKNLAKVFFFAPCTSHEEHLQKTC